MTDLRYIEGALVGSKYKYGMNFRFKIAIPCADVDEFALLIEHDGQNDTNVNAMLKLADEGKAPYCVSVGVASGDLLLPDGTQRNMRMNNYDLFDREYGDFLIYELIPYIEKTYSVKFAESPDMHCVSGGSSGGISAFVIAWFHPEYFHRVYMSSPSFLAMGRGNEIPYLIRKYETKPLRIYEESSENEPNEYFVWSKSIDDEAREALTFAKYDFKYKYFAGEGHCSRYWDANEAYERFEWLWKNWQTESIKAPANSDRISQIIPFGSKWDKCDSFPETEVNKSVFSEYETAVLSNDGNVWYAANKNQDSVYMFINNGNISMDNRIVHVVLHTLPEQKIFGAIDLAVDKTDRLFVLTEIGIQCVRSFGLIDAILDLPDESKPEKIAITDSLYVKTENGIYKRRLCDEHITESEEKRKQVSYYD